MQRSNHLFLLQFIIEYKKNPRSQQTGGSKISCLFHSAASCRASCPKRRMYIPIHVSLVSIHLDRERLYTKIHSCQSVTIHSSCNPMTILFVRIFLHSERLDHGLFSKVDYISRKPSDGSISAARIPPMIAAKIAVTTVSPKAQKK